jgi:hypothetical protein
MKRALLIGLGLLMSLALVAPASAFVFVFADVQKDKDVTVEETITINKTVTIDAKVVTAPEKAAESLALVNQDNFGNYACENCAEKTDRITNSVNANIGIIHTNQAAGNMNNQGNVVALAVDSSEIPPPPPPPEEPPQADGTGFANAEASMSQSVGNFILLDGTIRDDDDTRPDLVVLKPNIVNSIAILYRDSWLQKSVLDNQGIVGVNQAAGQMNNQANSVSLAVSLLGGVALSEADLGQHTFCGNGVYETATDKTAKIEGSILRNYGVIGVNQSSGNMANQGNNVSMAAALSTVPDLPTP